MAMQARRRRKGFTLIELLVVIAIIGVLSAIVLASLNTARDKATASAATQELRQIANATLMLEVDTGRAPFGCPVGLAIDLSDNEGPVSDPNAGFSQAPGASGNRVDPDCAWLPGEVAEWNGPYIQAASDPWGRPYIVDVDYHIHGTSETPYNCPGGSGPDTVIPVVMSAGPTITNPGGINDYDCDDIVYRLDENTFLPTP